MDKAIIGYMRIGFFRIGVFDDAWDRLVQQIGNLGATSLTVTRKRLTLGDRDTTTGWYSQNYDDSTMEIYIIAKGTTPSLLPPGTYVRTEALGLTADPVLEGDEIIANDVYYEVKTVRLHYLGDGFYFRECDLTLLPLQDLTGATYTASTVEDARYRNKVYLQTWLSSTALPNYIVAYGEPDYPLVRVFKEKAIDLVFSIGTPDSVALPVGVGYIENVPITIWCIDKTNISGTKLRWQAETELRRICEEHPTGGSMFTWQRLGDNEKNLGSTVLYSVNYVVNYKRYS